MKIRESTMSEQISGFLQACVENVCRSLETKAKVVVAAKLVVDEPKADLGGVGEAGIWMRFGTGATGEQAFLLSSEDALKLAEILSKVPTGSPGALRQDQLEDLIAVFAQAAAATARSLVVRLGREVAFDFAGSQRPPWTPAAQATFQLVVSPNPPVLLTLKLSPELARVLESIEKETVTSSAEGEAVRASAGNASSRDSNIDLLMDVELDVSLRFGERKLLLKEVLELGPGSLIELDQEVQDPVELLVGKKVVARGDVVIVDGNYGLRVTEIASPSDRIRDLGFRI